ncbi:MAG: CBS domain-containing protein [Pseudomonadota bacterium]
MPVPTNYAGPRENENKKKTTFSQTPVTSQAQSEATVSDILDKKGRTIFSVRSDATMSEAVDLLREKRIGALLVVSDNGELEGILSERDIVRKLSETPGKVLAQTVEALMTKTVQTAAPTEPLTSILKRMTEGRFRHMPVLLNGRLDGMITIGDVVNHRLRDLEYETVKLKQIIVG